MALPNNKASQELPPRAKNLFQRESLNQQPIPMAAKFFRDRRCARTPKPTKPISSIAHVEASGMGATPWGRETLTSTC
jgi:hypothetical protein